MGEYTEIKSVLAYVSIEINARSVVDVICTEIIEISQQVQPAIHTLYQRGVKMELERIVSILIHLLEDQENAKISYRIIPPDENKKLKKETA